MVGRLLHRAHQVLEISTVRPSVLMKLDARDRMQAVIAAYESGFLDDGD